MATKKEEILAQCIADVKAERASVEDCLAKYPRLRKELEPLLKIALAIEPPPEVSPSPTFKARARARLLAQIHAQRPVTKGRRLRYISWTPRERRFSMVAIVIAIIVALAAIGGGTVYASQDALPGDVLYPVKTTIEDARLFFAFSDEAKAGTYLAIAGTRLDELSRLPGERSRFVERLMERYRYNLERGLDFAEQRIEQGGNASGLLARFQERLAHHQEVLQTVYEQVPEEAQPAIEHAINVSGQGLERANRLRARAHLENAAQRLARVSEMAQAGRMDEVIELLGEYDEDLASFVEAASETGDVELLLELACERLDLVFVDVLAIVPDEARSAIEDAQAKTMKGFDEATEAVGRGQDLKDAWQEFEVEWEEFMPQWEGEMEPGSEKWQDAWQEFEGEWEQFSPQWEGAMEPGSEEWQDAWQEFKTERGHSQLVPTPPIP